MNLQQFKKLIREEVRRVLKEETFYNKMQRINSGWSKEKALADFANEYETRDGWGDFNVTGDYEEHQKYLKDAEKMLDALAKKTPNVKVGDLVNVYAKSMNMQCVGNIVEEVAMRGHDYGFAGNVLPAKIPAWKIDCYTDKRGFEDQEKRLVVKGKTYYYVGTVQYPQHEEGMPKTFSKLN